jgi:hypothetical protein
VRDPARRGGDGRDFEALVRYMMRSPVSLTRLRFTPGATQVVYARKGGHDASEPGEDERVDAEESVARVLVQIPDPRRHVVRYYGAYSNRARGQRPKVEGQFHGHGSREAEEPQYPLASPGPWAPHHPIGHRYVLSGAPSGRTTVVFRNTKP